MKDITTTPIEKHRLQNVGPWSSTSDYGNNGAFLIPHKGIDLFCIVSDQLMWDHVSVTVRHRKKDRQIKRCPTWEEMSFVRDCFFSDDEVVVQLHVANKDHINVNDFCLHLWRKQDVVLELPPKMFV